MEIISSRSRTVKSDESRGRQNIFYVFGCSTMSTIFADSQWRLGNIDIWILKGLMWCSKIFVLPWYKGGGGVIELPPLGF